MSRGSEKSKFETDDEYRIRQSSIRKAFVEIPIKVNDEWCPTEFDHKEQIYKIENCVISNVGEPIVSETNEGEPFILSNAFDSRKIRRIVVNEYVSSFPIKWSANYNISRETARSLESNMVAGVWVSVTDTAKGCPICDTRKLNDSVGDFSKSMNALTDGKRGEAFPANWKQDAFKDGSILEVWKHAFGVSKIYDVVIFSKLDNRLIYRIKFSDN